MEYINAVHPTYWAYLVLLAATIFVVLWGADALTHRKIAHADLTDRELQTHRNILLASVLMEASLVGMFWFPGLMLPLFIAFFITRTAHEFIDEVKYHADRCTPKENYFHLGMWMSVLIKTFGLFFWGFFTQYQGITDLSFGIYSWAVIIFVAMAWIGWREWWL